MDRMLILGVHHLSDTPVPFLTTGEASGCGHRHDESGDISPQPHVSHRHPRGLMSDGPRVCSMGQVSHCVWPNTWVEANSLTAQETTRLGWPRSALRGRSREGQDSRWRGARRSEWRGARTCGSQGGQLRPARPLRGRRIDQHHHQSRLRRARGMRDEEMLLLKVKWATAHPIGSARDLARLLTVQPLYSRW